VERGPEAPQFSKRERTALLQKLAAGQPPPPRLALATLAGFDNLVEGWSRDLSEYVCGGGSLLRVLFAPVGTGKTHLARALQALAAEKNFLVCQVDAAAQHTDDDLALHAAFCAGLTHPAALLGEEGESGLRSVLERVADSNSQASLRRRLHGLGIPVPSIADALPKLVGAISRQRRSSAEEEDIDVTLRLLSGEVVDRTRSLAKLRRAYPGPLLRTLGRAPGKRDGRLWLESVLKALPALGFSGVVWILDEHDEANQRVMDRHIIQLRRLADRLAEGRLPGSFVVYLVLEDFPSRIRTSHSALDQRLRPVLTGAVPGRSMVPLGDARDVDPRVFLDRIAERIHALVRGTAVPQNARQTVTRLAARSCNLGGVDTRAFVQAFSTFLIDSEP
jgi:hypothetical protein